MNRAEILDTARQIVTQGRNYTYGEPEDLFAALHLVKRGLDMARGGRARIPADDALDLAALKMVRAAYRPGHIDSAIDGAAYFAIFGELAAVPDGTWRENDYSRLRDTIVANAAEVQA